MKPKSLLPARDGSRSVFRVGGLKPTAVFALAQREVGDKRKKMVVGWAQFLASAVYKAGLTLDPDDMPPRHANILGWPEAKEEQIEKAQDLAAASTLYLAGEING